MPFFRTIFCLYQIKKKSKSNSIKVHIFWEGHKILRNLHLTFDCMYCSQTLGEDFAKFCGLLRIYELYLYNLSSSSLCFCSSNCWSFLGKYSSKEGSAWLVNICKLVKCLDSCSFRFWAMASIFDIKAPPGAWIQWIFFFVMCNRKCFPWKWWVKVK